MHRQQRAEHDAEALLGLGHAHRFSEPRERNIKELFNHPRKLAIPSRVAVSALALNRNPDTICAHPRRPAANAYCHSR